MLGNYGVAKELMVSRRVLNLTEFVSYLFVCLLVSYFVYVLYMLENRMLSRRVGPKRNERNLHNGELCKFHTLPSIIRVIKSRRVRRVRNIERRVKRGIHINCWLGEPG
jgi:hypothetical protein